MKCDCSVVLCGAASLSTMPCERCSSKTAKGQQKLCSRCRKIYEKEDGFKKVIVNDVLMYAETHRHGSSKDALVNAIASRCDSDNILSAKDTLVYHFADTGVLHSEMLVHRQNSPNRTDDMANTEDILKALESLEENNIDVTFVSDNWKVLPKSTPEEMTEIGVCQRLALLEAKFERYDLRLSDMCVDIKATKDKVSVIEGESAAHGDQLQQLVGSALMTQGGSKNNNTATTSAPTSPSLAQVVAGSTNAANSVKVSTRVADAPPAGVSVTSNGAHANPLSNRVDDDGFITPRHHAQQQMRLFRQEQKKNMMAQRGPTSHPTPRSGQHQLQAANGGGEAVRRTRRQGLVGEASGTGISATAASREFFVTYVNKECTLEQMKQHINFHGITERDLAIREGNDYNSFVLKISVEDVEKVRNPSMWPKGVFVRKFFTAKK